MDQRVVVLHEQVTDTDSLHIWARVDAAGDLRIDGQDLGEFVQQLFGCEEYEYRLTVRAADVPAP